MQRSFGAALFEKIDLKCGAHSGLALIQGWRSIGGGAQSSKYGNDVLVIYDQQDLPFDRQIVNNSLQRCLSIMLTYIRWYWKNIISVI